jgi:hypothetical protein
MGKKTRQQLIDEIYMGIEALDCDPAQVATSWSTVATVHRRSDHLTARSDKSNIIRTAVYAYLDSDHADTDSIDSEDVFHLDITDPEAIVARLTGEDWSSWCYVTIGEFRTWLNSLRADLAAYRPTDVLSADDDGTLQVLRKVPTPKQYLVTVRNAICDEVDERNQHYKHTERQKQHRQCTNKLEELVALHGADVMLKKLEELEELA